MIKQGGRQTGVAKSYLKQYQALIRKPAETIRNEGFALQDLIDWQKVESCPPYLLSSPHLTSPHLSSASEAHPSPSLYDPHFLPG